MAEKILVHNVVISRKLIFGTPDQQYSLSHFYPVDILGSLLHPSDCVLNLGVFFTLACYSPSETLAIFKCVTLYAFADF